MSKAKKLNISAEAKSGKAQIRVTGYITNWRNTAAEFEALIDQLVSDGVTDADVFIRTYGGNCFEAAEIYNLLTEKFASINTEAGAYVCSAGTYIMCAGEKRSAPKNLQFMVHQPMGGVEGTADDIEAYLELVKNVQGDYLRVYVETTGQSEEFITSHWKKDWWMNATKAKQYGFITDIKGENDVLTQDDLDDLEAAFKLPVKVKSAVAASISITQPNPDTDMKGVFAILGLAEGKSEGEVIAAIEKLKAKAAKADELEAKAKNAEAAALKVKVDAVLDKAVENKQITASERGFFEKNLQEDFEGTKAVIEARPVGVKLSAQVKSGTDGGEDRSKWTFADWQEKDPKGLAAMHEQKPEEFEKLAEAHYGK